MKVDVYDFDKTIVPFDSGSLFVCYCLVHYPWTLVTLPILAVAGILLLTKAISFTQFKRVCYIMLPLIPTKKAVKNFWDKYQHEVHGWFLDRDRYTIVISASPDFLLEEIQKRLGFEKLISTRHNSVTGKIIGENCRGQEKVKRLYQEYTKDDIQIIDVYSDSLKHDKYIFALAQNNCYHIVKSKKVKFDYAKKFGNK